jgi:hypothetical protein
MLLPRAPESSLSLDLSSTANLRCSSAMYRLFVIVGPGIEDFQGGESCFGLLGMSYFVLLILGFRFGRVWSGQFSSTVK